LRKGGRLVQESLDLKKRGDGPRVLSHQKLKGETLNWGADRSSNRKKRKRTVGDQAWRARGEGVSIGRIIEGTAHAKE